MTGFDEDVDLEHAGRREIRASFAGLIDGGEMILDAVGMRARGNRCGAGVQHRVAVDGSIENRRLFLGNGMLLGERLDRGNLALQEAAGLQETVNLLRRRFDTRGTDAIAREDLGIWLRGNQVKDAGFQSAAAEGAKRNDLLAGEIDLPEQGNDRRCIGAEPNGIAQEDDVIRGKVGLQG